jgi:hypothetical protein
VQRLAVRRAAAGPLPDVAYCCRAGLMMATKAA